MSEYYLVHHGIKGQKWGVRRYQNEDGTLTPAGIKRYGRYDKEIDRNNSRAEVMAKARTRNRAIIEGRYNKKISKLQADKDSYDPIKEGVTNRRGRVVLTKEDVKGLTDKIQSKIDALESKKNAKLKDFDLGSKFVADGYKKYSEVIQNYKDVKIKSLDDKAFKKSSEYKDAVKKYTNQILSDMYYGSSAYTTLIYAGNAARDYYKEHPEDLKPR